MASNMNQIGPRYLMIINVNIKPLAVIQHFLWLLSHSVVSDSSVTPRTATRQAPLSMGVPGKYTGVSCHFILQRTFLTQDWQMGLLHWQIDSLPLSHQRRHNSTFSLAQSLSRVQVFATAWTAARQTSLSITNSRSLLKLMSIESVMPSKFNIE